MVIGVTVGVVIALALSSFAIYFKFLKRTKRPVPVHHTAELNSIIHSKSAKSDSAHATRLSTLNMIKSMPEPSIHVRNDITNTVSSVSSATASIDATMTLMLSIPGYMKLDQEKDLILMDKIGSGGSGSVYRAKLKTQQNGDIDAAVKITSDLYFQNFRFEIAIMGFVLDGH